MTDTALALDPDAAAEDEASVTGRVKAIFSESDADTGRVTDEFFATCEETLAVLGRERHQCVNSRPPGARRVLIVEDDPGLSRSMHRALTQPKMADYVDRANTVEEAIIKVGETFYDVLVLDYRLTNGTARDLAHIARQKQPQALIILISGVIPTEELRQVAQDIAAFEWHTKPLSGDDLRAAVRRAFKEPHQTAAAQPTVR